MNDLFSGDFVSPTPNNLILSPVYQTMPMNIYHREEVQEVVVTEQKEYEPVFTTAFIVIGVLIASLLLAKLFINWLYD